jgi:DNA-binding MurR/RpiR family transcriptional regulator
VYTVRVTLDPQEWESALEKAAGWVPRSADDLPPAIQADVLRRVMKQALQRHHEWLARHEIAAVITAVEENERTYIFYFESAAAASRFQEEFGGDLTQSGS